MSKLFRILDGINSSDYADETLASIQAIQNYAENGCDEIISDEDAARIQSVGIAWRDQQKNGNGEWSRMRHDAMSALDD